MKRQVLNQGKSNILIIHVTQYTKVSHSIGEVRRGLSPVESLGMGSLMSKPDSSFHGTWSSGFLRTVCCYFSPRLNSVDSINLVFYSFLLPPHWGQPLAMSSVLFVGYSSHNDIPDPEIYNDYTCNTWMYLCCRNSNTSGKVKALLNSSASRHAALLPCGSAVISLVCVLTW